MSIVAAIPYNLSTFELKIDTNIELSATTRSPLYNLLYRVNRLFPRHWQVDGARDQLPVFLRLSSRVATLELSSRTTRGEPIPTPPPSSTLPSLRSAAESLAVLRPGLQRLKVSDCGLEYLRHRSNPAQQTSTPPDIFLRP